MQYPPSYFDKFTDRTQSGL
uniref:Uncharacterized protein n=1 Tax=Rhizophora mucronata TaxID=61149 RepID=A0A2P2P6X3_RHIMU